MIQTESTPNPNSIKFLSENTISAIGTEEFQKGKSKNLKNWRTVINTGEESGQTVFHLHVHFLAGRKMSWPPG